LLRASNSIIKFDWLSEQNSEFEFVVLLVVKVWASEAQLEFMGISRMEIIDEVAYTFDGHFQIFLITDILFA
jgi:uncharacterized membrane protein